MHDELTRSDLQKMQEEIDYRVQVLRPKLIEDVQTARAFGDLSENFEYKCAKQDKNRNDARIRYLQRMIKTAQVIEELIQMAKDFQAALEREAALGLSPDEIAFYDALANNESAVRELGDEILKKIAVEITEKLRNSTTVDWQVRESVRAKLRILVRRTLKKWKYPPVGEEAAIELVLKQAESLSNAWSR